MIPNRVLSLTATALTLAACAGASNEALECHVNDARPVALRNATTRAETTDVRLGKFGDDNHLVDAHGRALYVSATDLPTSELSSCLDVCAEHWQPFDVRDLSVGKGLDPHDFSRFARPDGRFQTTYRGRPLYRFALDGDTGEVTGDGLDGRWFVARENTDLLALNPDTMTVHR